MKKMKRKCITCGARINKSNRYFPFCSKRCSLADLDNWLKERYKLRGDDILLRNDDFSGN